MTTSTTTSTTTTTPKTAAPRALLSGEGAVRRRVDVSVMGLSLSLRTDRDDAWIHGIAGQVNRRVDELRRSAKNASAQQLAVLVALNLAEELQAERQRASGRERALEGELEALASGALARVQAALAALDSDDGDDDSDGDSDSDDDDDGDDDDGDSDDSDDV